MGKPKDPDYFKKYRAAHPDYAARDRARRRALKVERAPRIDRSAEYAKRNAARSTPPPPPLPALFPELSHGQVFSFWHEELSMDLMQERALAELEGRDPDEAARAYRRREVDWSRHSAPYLLDAEPQERWA